MEQLKNKLLFFRHDRVYNWLASKAIVKFINTIELNNSFLKEPYLAEIIGLALNEDTITDEIIEFIKLHNSLALFYSFTKVFKCKYKYRKKHTISYI